MTRSKLRLSLGSSSDSRRPGVGGRIGATLFFLVWLAIPTIILVVIVRDTWKNGRTWRWPAVECTVLRSGVDQTGSDGDYAFRVEYAYAPGQPGSLASRPFTSTVYARSYRGASDYADAQRLVLQYPAGGKSTCYVNPANPGEAVLKRNSLGTGALVLLPMLFILIGAGGLWFTWQGGSAGSGTSSISAASATPAGPLSKRGAGSASPWLAVLFFGAFGGCGGVVLVTMGARALNVFAAKSWKSVPATVVSSRVRSHRSDDATTYSVDVLYRYSVNGREYRSNRYGFMRGSSSGYAGKREVADKFPSGTRVTAYVNPSDPTDAVLERGFTWDMLFLLIPAAFVAIGVIGMFYSTRRALAKRLEQQLASVGNGAGDEPAPATQGGRGSRAFTPRRSLQDEASPVALKPRQSPIAKLVGFTVAALFWNGIVSVFLFQMVKGWRTGHGDVCMTLFLVPFVAIGAGLVVGIGYLLLALFNPRVVLVLDRGQLALGESADLRWSLAGRSDRIHRLVMRLEGREEATYRQGTSTHTDKYTFFSLDVVDTENLGEIRDGKGRIPVSPGTMHSFTAANNKIVWVLTVRGHIRGWPDVKDEYLLTVAPRPRTQPIADQTAGEPRETTWTA